jgi:L-fuconolactonase
MRIDAHHHLWTIARGDYGWLTPDLAPIYRDFCLSDLAPHLSATQIEGTIESAGADATQEKIMRAIMQDHRIVARGGRDNDTQMEGMRP